MSADTSIMTQAEFLAAIDTSWDNLDRYLASLSEAQLTRNTDAAGWTVEDHVIHLAIWEDDLNALLDGLDRRATMNIDDEQAWNDGD